MGGLVPPSSDAPAVLDLDLLIIQPKSGVIYKNYVQ